MTAKPPDSKSRLRFSLRTALFAMLVVGLALGWRISLQRADQSIQKLNQRINYLQGELAFGIGRLENKLESKYGRLEELGNARSGGVWISGSRLEGGVLKSDDSLFQHADLSGCELSGATLACGSASFQSSLFENANLAGASLTGGSSSFQEASFAGADLTGATLGGGGASFQAASFKDATLHGAKVLVAGMSAFQAVNIDSAQFQGADLSSIDHRSLESCYFEQPPRYNEKTSFPQGFDPAKQGWKRAPDADQSSHGSDN